MSNLGSKPISHLFQLICFGPTVRRGVAYSTLQYILDALQLCMLEDTKFLLTMRRGVAYSTLQYILDALQLCMLKDMKFRLTMRPKVPRMCGTDLGGSGMPITPSGFCCSQPQAQQQSAAAAISTALIRTYYTYNTMIGEGTSLTITYSLDHQVSA
jgi:hypothetical protein